MNFKYILPLFIFLFSHKSQAALIFEPSFGYKKSTLEMTETGASANTSTYTLNAPVGGLKIGMYSMTGVSLSLVGEYSSGKAKSTDSSITYSPAFTHTLAGVQLGVSAMSSIKIYLGYAPYDILELKSVTGEFNGFKLSGQSYQAGLMFFPFERVGLGAQYNVHSFDSISGSDFTRGSNIKTYYQKVDYQDLTFILSILI